MDIITGLKLVRSTLDTIKVEGIENMNRLVGCASMLDTIVKIMETPQEPESKEPESEEESVDG